MSDRLTQQQAEEVIDWLFGGDRDVDIKMHSVKIVKCRGQHDCMNPERYGHCVILAGQTAIRETALVDGRWCSSYVCEECAAREWNNGPWNEMPAVATHTAPPEGGAR